MDLQLGNQIINEGKHLFINLFQLTHEIRINLQSRQRINGSRH